MPSRSTPAGLSHASRTRESGHAAGHLATAYAPLLLVRAQPYRAAANRCSVESKYGESVQQSPYVAHRASHRQFLADSKLSLFIVVVAAAVSVPFRFAQLDFEPHILENTGRQ